MATRVACWLTVLAVMLYYTNTGTGSNTSLPPPDNISTTSSSSSNSSSSSSNRKRQHITTKEDDPGPTLSCQLQTPTEIVHCVLSSVGVGFSAVAMAEVTRRKHLNRPFRVLLFSLTVTDLMLSSSSFLLGSLALYLSFHQDLQWMLLCTVCTVLTGAYHSLLICGATTILSLSLDRIVAVFAPVRYRALVQREKKLGFGVLIPWVLAGLCVLVVPLSWHFYGSSLQVQQAQLTCWPLVAVKKEFLIVQGVMLLLSVMGITLAHLSLLYKLTRRAVLVVPMFGTRTSDSTAGERLQTRRNVRHASTQACTFLLLHLAIALYLLWLADGSVHRRVSKACEARYLVLSQLPVVSTIINSLLTLWRFRRQSPSVVNTTAVQSNAEPPRSGNNPGSGLHHVSSSVHVPAVSRKSEPHVGITDGEAETKRKASECRPSCSETQDKQCAGAAAAAAEDGETSDQSEGSRSSIWWPPGEENYNDNCRADPALLDKDHTLVKELV